MLRESKTIGDLGEQLETKGKLAACLQRQARLNEAHAICVEIRDQRIRLSGKDAGETIKAENNVFYTLAQLGEYTEAANKLRELFERSSSLLGEEHETTIGVLTNLGYPLARLNKADELRGIAQRLYDLNYKVRGADHPDTLNALKNLAMTKVSDSPEEAIELYQTGLELCTARFGEDHIETVGMRLGLANSYDAQGNKQLAETLYRRSLSTLRGPGKPFDFNTAMCLNNLANIVKGRDIREAKELYAEAAAGLAETYGEDNPQTQSVLSNVANCARELGEYEEAVRLLRRALVVFEDKFGSEHGITLNAQQDLVKYLHKADRNSEARKLVEDLLKSARDADAKQHVFEGLRCKAAIYLSLGEAVVAERCMQEAFAIAAKEFGDSHAKTLETVRDLASILGHDLRRHQDAVELWNQTLPIHVKALGEDHADTEFVRTRLAEDQDQLSNSTSQ